MREILIAAAMAGLLAGCAQIPAYAQEGSSAKPTVKSSYAKKHSDYRPYNADTDSMADVGAALARAKTRGTKALIVMGANWCHDSRGLAARFNKPEFQTLIADNYELVYVSVGTAPRQKDQNKEISKRFGVDAIAGTPTVFIANPDGTVLNPDSAGYWRRTDSIPTDMSYAYFKHYADK